MRAKRVGCATTAAATAVLVIAGCGSSSSGGGGGGGTRADAFTLVTATAAKTIAAKNAKVAFTVKLDTTASDVTVNGTGVMDLAQNTFRLSLPLPAGSAVKGTIDEVGVGGIIYMRLPAAARSKTGGREWVSIDPAKLIGATKSAASSYNEDLTSNLNALRAISRQVTVVGKQDVRGVQTTHYRANIDLAKAGKLRGVQAQTLATYQAALGNTLPEDVYLDSQGRARRVSVTITPKTGTPAAAELRSESVSIDFYDFGQADTSGITAPPKSQTIDFSKTALAGA